MDNCMTFLFSLLLESHNTGFWLGNQWGFHSCKWEDFDLDYIFFCNLIFLVETFRMQKNISFGKGSLSTLVYVFKSSLNYHWLKIMSLFWSLLKFVRRKQIMSAEFQVELALETEHCSNLEVNHHKSQICPLSPECMILKGYTHRNVHLPYWCPYWTSERNIFGFQASFRKHKLHFTFCKNTEKKTYSEKPQRETQRAWYQKRKHSISTWILVLAGQYSITDLVKISKFTTLSVLLPAGEERDRIRSFWHGLQGQPVSSTVMDKRRTLKIWIIWCILFLYKLGEKSKQITTSAFIYNGGKANICRLWFIINMNYCYLSV